MRFLLIFKFIILLKFTLFGQENDSIECDYFTHSKYFYIDKYNDKSLIGEQKVFWKQVEDLGYTCTGDYFFTTTYCNDYTQTKIWDEYYINDTLFTSCTYKSMKGDSVLRILSGVDCVEADVEDFGPDMCQYISISDLDFNDMVVFYELDGIDHFLYRIKRKHYILEVTIRESLLK